MKKTVMLKKNYEFKDVLSRGYYYSGKYLDVFEKYNNKNINMLGIAVSKKTGNSVIRNKIKRLIRENYRLLEDNIKPKCSIVILWKKKVENKHANFYNIKDDMENIIKKINARNIK